MRFEYDRNESLSKRVSEIARLKALRAFAEGNSDYSEAEAKSFEQDIRALRKAIISELSTDELKALTAQSLAAEDCQKVIPKHAPVSTEITDPLIKGTLAKMSRDAVAQRSFFTVKKGFGSEEDQPIALVFPRKPDESMASLSDAMWNEKERKIRR
ncbi:hypothetical protein [Bradyrhizobium sp. HKCCYLS3013]|uniref:hypothetical protein n=1 Tax=Bradyrhizobium sp. HKCCYLS3013 TaxID=3420735 RepID=UPI003EBF393F